MFVVGPVKHLKRLDNGGAALDAFTGEGVAGAFAGESSADASRALPCLGGVKENNPKEVMPHTKKLCVWMGGAPRRSQERFVARRRRRHDTRLRGDKGDAA